MAPAQRLGIGEETHCATLDVLYINVHATYGHTYLCCRSIWIPEYRSDMDTSTDSVLILDHTKTLLISRKIDIW